MTRRVVYLAASAGLLAVLSGCALNMLDLERREAWRGQAEAACFAQNLVSPSPYIEVVRSINDRGTCGIDKPLQVAALDRGTVRVGPTAQLGCSQTAALESWFRGSVQPAALSRFGSPVVSIRQMSAYACRARNNARRGKISEHAFGNALDIGAFTLADGRTITVKNGWNGSQAERDFLREVHAGACTYFRTVLGPGVPQHGDHFHVDLARHGRSGTSHYCKPTPVRPPLRGIDNTPVAAIPDASAAPAAGYTVVEPSDAEVNELVFGGNPFGVGGDTDPRRLSQAPEGEDLEELEDH